MCFRVFNSCTLEILSILLWHYDDVIMGEIASQITSLTIFYSTVYSSADQRKHQSSASLAFMRGIHRGPVNSLHRWPVTRKMFPFDDVIMVIWECRLSSQGCQLMQLYWGTDNHLSHPPVTSLVLITLGDWNNNWFLRFSARRLLVKWCQKSCRISKRYKPYNPNLVGSALYEILRSHILSHNESNRWGLFHLQEHASI